METTGSLRALALVLGFSTTGCSAPTSDDPVDCAGVQAPAPCVYRVDAATTDPGCGLDWDAPLPDIQPAIDAAHAAADASPCEVWVATGTYHVYQRRRMDTLRLASGVFLYGGFAGGEASREQRDPSANPTVIDGHEAGGAEQVYHVVTGADDAVLDGFVITGGNARSARYGGGMYNDGVSPTVVDCTFEGNEAGFYGGGMFNSRNAPIISGCRFIDNQAKFGGGIYLQGSLAEITDTRFEDNEAKESGGGVANFSHSDVHLQSCTFVHNEARVYGGAVYNHFKSHPLLSACTFVDNEAGDDGDDVYDGHGCTSIFESAR